jgi:hypothetical protein
MSRPIPLEIDCVYIITTAANEEPIFYEFTNILHSLYDLLIFHAACLCKNIARQHKAVKK